VYTVHSSMAVASYEWSAVPDGATGLPFTLTPLPASANSSSSSSNVRKPGGGAVTHSVSVTMSNSSSNSSSSVSAVETAYSGEGVPAVNNSCFGLVVGSKSRRITSTTATTAASSTTTATTKATTSSDSNSVSDRLVSCGYWDNSVRVHSLASDSKSSSSSSAAYAQQCCAAEGAHTGVVSCLSASDGGLMVT
jgi:hypothetical protein